MTTNALILTILGYLCTGVVGQVPGCPIENVQFDAYTGYALLPPSQFVNCVKEVSINATNFIDYVAAANQVYEYNYAFYFSAIDATSNEPQNYQADLGYQVYHGPNQGTIDVAERSQEIIDRVVASGVADASMFWEVAEIYQLLRDGHVSLNGGPLGNLSSSMVGSGNWVALYLQSYFDKNQTTFFMPIFALEDGEITLVIEESDVNNTVISSKRVSTIDGQIPGDFLQMVANSPLYRVKSSGSRINIAMDGFGYDQGFRTRHSDTKIFEDRFATSPDFFPDSFPIQYEDGTNDTGLSYVVVGSIGMEYLSSFGENSLVLDISRIEQEMNMPGRLVSQLDQFVSTFLTGLDSCLLPTSSIPERRIMESTKRRQSQSNTDSDTMFDGIFLNCSGIVWRYAIMEGYTVLKAGGGFPGIFECGWLSDEGNDDFNGFLSDLTTAWQEMMEMSMEQGSNKLVVDVSGNVGGWPILGLSLAIMMYPEVKYEHFVTWDSAPYNEAMESFIDTVDPYFRQIIAEFVSLPEPTLEEYLQSQTDAWYCVISAILELYADFFEDNFAKEVIADFTETATAFVSSRDAESLQFLLESILYLHQNMNPWTVTIAGGTAYASNRTTAETVIRGGTEARFVRDFDVQYVPIFANISEVVKGLGTSFDEYIILSNGACGSTCDVFTTTTQQIWRNRDITGAQQPLSIVSYGGAGEPPDASQYAGGFVENPSIDINYSPILTLLFTGWLTNQTFFDSFWDVFDHFESVTPNVPFFLNEWPTMPTSEGVNGLMMPSGVPIEYLKKTPDYYIPQIFNMPSHDVLAELYTTASAFFGRHEDSEGGDGGDGTDDGGADVDGGDGTISTGSNETIASSNETIASSSINGTNVSDGMSGIESGAFKVSRFMMTGLLAIICSICVSL